ncbi:MAG: hypothetical protein Tsb009_17140 [Planctomycetaceae bacterium]
MTDSTSVATPENHSWQLVYRTIKLTLLVAFLILVALGVEWWFFPSVPDTTPDKIKEIELELNSDFFREDRSIATQMTSSNPEVISQLGDVIKTAERGESHKCADIGWLKIHYHNGKTENLGILPGHDESYFEYRWGSRTNRVNRKVFLEWMKQLGVKKLPLKPSSGKLEAI